MLGSGLILFPLDPDKRNYIGTAETRRKVKRLLAVSCIIYFKVDLKGKKKAHNI